MKPLSALHTKPPKASIPRVSNNAPKLHTPPSNVAHTVSQSHIPQAPQAPQIPQNYGYTQPTFEAPHYYPEFQYAQAYPGPYYYPQQIVSDPYGQPYTVYTPITYYQPPMMTYNFHNFVKPRKSFSSPQSPQPTRLVPQNLTDGGIVPAQTRSYATAVMARRAPEIEEEDEELEPVASPRSPSSYVDVKMTSEDLYRSIMAHFHTYPQCRVSWLNRLLAKCNSARELHKAINLFHLYQTKLIETTPETGTLLIKAACRAGMPERALEMLKDVEHVRIWPTLGGIHYLMINFSLKKDTSSVLEAFEATKLRRLQPTTRTYHILIRECVDNNEIEKALQLAKDAKKNNVIPNRVTYNILMNGLRKSNRASNILELRKEMNDYQIEINDTSVKFTALAYMMLGKAHEAVTAFKEYPELDSKMEEFCSKFFEVFEEEEYTQKACVIKLFRELEKSKVPLPGATLQRVNELEKTLSSQQPTPEPSAQ